MSNSIVLDLQRKALDSGISISDLIRQAYVLSRKLQIPEFEAWIKREMYGYSDDDEIPKYRVVNSEIKAFNPLRGWIPVIFEMPKIAENLSSIPISQAIGEVESLTQGKEDDYIIIKFTHETDTFLRERLKTDMQIARHTTIVEFKRIIDAVRNALLKWTIDLESDRILGEDMTITKGEKEIAQTVNYNIQNYIGTAIHSPIVQGSSEVNQKVVITDDEINSLLKEITDGVNELPLSSEEKGEITAYVDTTKSQLSIKNSNKIIIMESLKSVRNIIEGIASSHIATQLKEKINYFIENLFN